MTERFPGYDVLAKQESPSWDAITRKVIERRLAVSRLPRFFTEAEWQVLGALCARILPQPPGRDHVPLPAYVDAKITEDNQDGYRHAAMPHQGPAWRRGLAALDAEARAAHAARFHTLAPGLEDALINRMQAGDLHDPAWGDMPCRLFFEHRVIPDITHAYYAHPTAWNEIGFGGPASPRGYVRMRLDRRDPWEAVEATHGTEPEARHRNRHVR